MKAFILCMLAAAVSAQGYGNIRDHNSVYTGPARHAIRPDYTDAKPIAAGPYKPADYKETPKPYQFQYQVKDEFGNEHHREESGNEQGVVQGTYGYTDAYGLFRQVEYTADDYGFKARVKTNEPGTDNQSPADVEVHADPVEINYDAPKKVGPKVAKPAGSYAAPAFRGGPSIAHRSGYLAPPRHHGAGAPHGQYAGPVYPANVPVHASAGYGPRRGVAVTTTHQRAYDGDQHYGHASKVASHRRPY